MTYTGSMAGTFAQRHARATDAALEAGAQELINGLKDTKPLGLTQGYTSGDFVTGDNVNAIFMTPVSAGPSGAKFILVSTDSPYALYWEMGHVNAFTRKYEREERWYPTLIRKDEDIFAAYARVYKRFME
jgi:hypothetical protein